MATHIYRITVKGRFAELDDAQRATLTAELAEHDVIRNGFDESGPLAYDRALDFFTFRFQQRERATDGEPPEDVRERALERALAKAVERLDAAGLGYRDLKVQGTDLADVWS